MSQEGRNSIGRGPGSRQSMQSYIMTHSRLKEREAKLIALGIHLWGPLISASVVPHYRGCERDGKVETGLLA